MIARVWKGWTTKENAQAYEDFLEGTVFPGLREIEGYIDGYLLRRDRDKESEFVTVNLFESLEAVKKFAGDDYEVPVFEPEARRLLAKVEPVARHYEVRRGPLLSD